jgi:hypothetical protein
MIMETRGPPLLDAVMLLYFITFPYSVPADWRTAQLPILCRGFNQSVNTVFAFPQSGSVDHQLALSRKWSDGVSVTLLLIFISGHAG